MSCTLNCFVDLDKPVTKHNYAETRARLFAHNTMSKEVSFVSDYSGYVCLFVLLSHNA